jgi:hypothetical protein
MVPIEVLAATVYTMEFTDCYGKSMVSEDVTD